MSGGYKCYGRCRGPDLPPSGPAPRKVYAQPVNYRAHQAEMQESPWSGTAPQVSSDQGMFLKASSAVSGPNDPILLPYSDRVIHHESELVMVIGKGGSMIPLDEALSHVFGYTCGLDRPCAGPRTGANASRSTPSRPSVPAS